MTKNSASFNYNAFVYFQLNLICRNVCFLRFVKLAHDFSSSLVVTAVFLIATVWVEIKGVFSSGEGRKVRKINNKVLNGRRARSRALRRGAPQLQGWKVRDRCWGEIRPKSGRKTEEHRAGKKRERGQKEWERGRRGARLRSRGLFNRFKKSPIIPRGWRVAEGQLFARVEGWHVTTEWSKWDRRGDVSEKRHFSF